MVTESPAAIKDMKCRYSYNDLTDVLDVCQVIVAIHAFLYAFDDKFDNR